MTHTLLVEASEEAVSEGDVGFSAGAAMVNIPETSTGLRMRWRAPSKKSEGGRRGRRHSWVVQRESIREVGK